MSIDVEKANDFIENIPLYLKAGSFDLEEFEENLIRMIRTNMKYVKI